MSENTMMAEANRSVTIRYGIRLEDGTKIDGRSAKPFTFRMGARKVIPALEAGVKGMALNEVRKIPVAAEQGYGKYNNDLVLKVDKKMFPDDLALAPGKTVQYQDRDGERASFIVQKVEGDSVWIDGNHPLAGQDLEYEVELLDVK